MGNAESVPASSSATLCLHEDDGDVNETVPRDIRIVQLSARGIVGVSGLSALTNVEQINMPHNRLSSVPDVWDLTGLRELQLSSNMLTSISPRVGALTAMVSLHLSRNSLEFLPDEIGDCSSLRWLNLANNPLQTLPRTLRRLQELALLNCEACGLRWLPFELAGVPATCEIFLFANRHLEVKVRRTGESCRQRLDEVFSGTTTLLMIRELAVEMLVGLQDLALPALVTLEIVDAAFPNAIPMYKKWDLITAVKHFHRD